VNYYAYAVKFEHVTY